MQGEAVISLSDWSFDETRDEGWAAWLQHTFFLKPTDECVSYILAIDSAPACTGIFLNGEHVIDYMPPDDKSSFELDVTPYVFLEDNTIAFRIECDKSESPASLFNGVRLQPVPCD